MKTLIAGLVFCLAFLLAGSTQKLKAQPPCPSDPLCPWSSTSFSTSLPVYVGGSVSHHCLATVYYCYRTCNGVFETKLQTIEFFNRDCVQGIDLYDIDFQKGVRAAIIDNAIGSIYTVTIEPCTGPSFSEIRYSVGECYAVIMRYGVIWFEICDDAPVSCWWQYSLCYDYSLGTPVLVKTLVSSGSSGTPECPGNPENVEFEQSDIDDPEVVLVPCAANCWSE